MSQQSPVHLKEGLEAAYWCLLLWCMVAEYYCVWRKKLRKQHLKIRQKGLSLWIFSFKEKQSLTHAVERATQIRFLLWVTSKITCLHWEQRMPQITAAPGLDVVALVMLLWEQPVAGRRESYSLSKTKQWQGWIWSCVASFYSKCPLCLLGCLLVYIFFLWEYLNLT